MLMSPENLLVIFDVEFVSKNLQPRNRQMVRQDFSDKTMYTTQFFTKNDCLLHSLLQHCFLKKKKLTIQQKQNKHEIKADKNIPTTTACLKSGI